MSTDFFYNLITRTFHLPLAGLEVLSTRPTSVFVVDDFVVNVEEPSYNTKVPELQELKKLAFKMSDNNTLHILSKIIVL